MTTVNPSSGRISIENLCSWEEKKVIPWMALKIQNEASNLKRKREADDDFSERMRKRKITIYYNDGSFFTGKIIYLDASLLFPQRKMTNQEKSISLGEGKMTYPDTTFYLGDCINGMKWGLGRLFLQPNYPAYFGHWENDRKHGFGKEILPDGNIYLGWFENGKKHGKGSLFLPKGDEIYVGDWEGGFKSGQGIEVFSTGRIYEGAFFDNQPHGQGTLYSAIGEEIFKGRWIKGQPVNTIRDK